MRVVRGVEYAWLSEVAGELACRVPGIGATHKEGFGRDKRIRASADFESLLRSGTRRNIGGFTFFFSPRSAGTPRLGILISRKHAAHASDRNRIKRCIREAFRQSQAGLGAIDLLVRPPYGLKPSTDTVRRVKSCLAKLAK